MSIIKQKEKGDILSAYRSSCACRLSYIALIVVAVFAVLFYVFHQQLSKHMAEICEYKGRQTATEIITDSINTSLDEEMGGYIIVERDSEGKITSIETDAKAVTALQNKICERINESLSEIENKTLSVPVGTLSGITFLSGRGSDVSLKLHQVGAVDSELKSEFVSSGVNQTKHRLSIAISVEITAVLPLHSTDMTIRSEYLLSETIIVGEIPDVYLNSTKDK